MVSTQSRYCISGWLYSVGIYMKTVTIDGGLLPFEAGSFNDLVKVSHVDKCNAFQYLCENDCV